MPERLLSNMRGKVRPEETPLVRPISELRLRRPSHLTTDVTPIQEAYALRCIQMWLRFSWPEDSPQGRQNKRLLEWARKYLETIDLATLGLPNR